MRLSRVRFTVRRMLVAVAVLGIMIGTAGHAGFRDRSHSHRHLAFECGCDRPDISQFRWPDRCRAAYHSGMGGVYGFFADLFGEPSRGCGIQILDSIPGDPDPPWSK